MKSRRSSRSYISWVAILRRSLFTQKTLNKSGRRIFTQTAKIRRRNSRNIPLLNITHVILVASIMTDPYLTLSARIFFFRVIWTALFNRTANSARASISFLVLSVSDNGRGTYLQVEGQSSARCTLHIHGDTDGATDNGERPDDRNRASELARRLFLGWENE